MENSFNCTDRTEKPGSGSEYGSDQENFTPNRTPALRRPFRYGSKASLLRHGSGSSTSSHTESVLGASSINRAEGIPGDNYGKDMLLEIISKQNELIKAQQETQRKLEAVLATGTSGKRKQLPPKPDVPVFVKGLVRDGYREAIKRNTNEWNVEKGKSIYSEENKAMSNFIADFIKGIPHASATDVVIDAALKRYFQTKRETASRQRSGGRHTEKMRKYERKNQKKRVRLRALKAKKWTPEKKQKVAKAIIIDLMSSEDEAEVDGEDIFVIRPLPWESDEVGKIKEALDQKWESMRSSRSRRLTLPRVEGEISSRPKPSNFSSELAWTLS